MTSAENDLGGGGGMNCLRCGHPSHEPGECKARYHVTFEKGEVGDPCLCEYDDMEAYSASSGAPHSRQAVALAVARTTWPARQWRSMRGRISPVLFFIHPLSHRGGSRNRTTTESGASFRACQKEVSGIFANLPRNQWELMDVDLFGIVTEAVAAYSSRAAVPPETGFNSEYAKGWTRGIDALVAALNQEAAKYGWGRIDDVKVRKAASALREVANAAAPAEPPALDVERLARALHEGQAHWQGSQTTFEEHRRGHMDEAEKIAAAYGGAAPDEALADIREQTEALIRHLDSVKRSGTNLSPDSISFDMGVATAQDAIRAYYLASLREGDE